MSDPWAAPAGGSPSSGSSNVPPGGSNAGGGGGSGGGNGRRWASGWRPARRDWMAGLATFVTAAVIGAPLGWAWAATATRINVQSALNDSETAFTRQVGVDLWFALLSLIFGVAVGLLVWWLSRPPDWPVPFGLAAGGLGGALLAGFVGRQINAGIPGLPHNATDLAQVLLRFQVRAPGWYAVYPAVALAVFLIASSLDQRELPRRLKPAPQRGGNGGASAEVSGPRRPLH